MKYIIKLDIFRTWNPNNLYYVPNWDCLQCDPAAVMSYLFVTESLWSRVSINHGLRKSCIFIAYTEQISHYSHSQFLSVQFMPWCHFYDSGLNQNLEATSSSNNSPANHSIKVTIKKSPLVTLYCPVELIALNKEMYTWMDTCMINSFKPRKVELGSFKINNPRSYCCFMTYLSIYFTISSGYVCHTAWNFLW